MNDNKSSILVLAFVLAALLFTSASVFADGEEERCNDPLLRALRLLEDGDVVWSEEGSTSAADYLVEIVFRSLEEENCDNWIAAFDVHWVLDFKKELDDLVLENTGTLLVEKSEGAYSVSFWAENEASGEGDLGALHLEYTASYTASADMPFELSQDEDGNPVLVPGAITIAVHAEATGNATESIDDRYVKLEGNVAAAADLALTIVPQGDGAFHYEGTLSWAWAFDVEGYVKAGKKTKNVDVHKEGADSIDFSGDTSIEELKAKAQELKALVEELLAALEG